VLVTVAVAVVLVCPLAWSLTPVLERGSPAMPMAGPAADIQRSAGPPGLAAVMGDGDAPGSGPAGPRGLPRPPMLPGEANVDRKLVDYLVANRGEEVFLVAGPIAHVVAPIIIETGMPAMALGGFGGRDEILTREQFADAVASGDVRFVLTIRRPRSGMGRRALESAMSMVGLDPTPVAPAHSGRSGPPALGPGIFGEPDALRWTHEACTPVPPSLWRSPPELPDAADGQIRPPFPRPGPGMIGGFLTLYDCRSDDQRLDS
jgi:hypothetical protein